MLAGVISLGFCFLLAGHTFAQSQFELKRIAKVEIVFSGKSQDRALAEQFRLTAVRILREEYSAPRIRDAIAAIYESRQVDSIVVSADLNTAGEVELRFEVKRKTTVQRVNVEILGESAGDNVTEQDLLFKLNLLTPGTAITEQTLQNNATEILTYLRERGFYDSEVTYRRQAMEDENDVAVTFQVKLGNQTEVNSIKVQSTLR